jgi:ABC-type transport system substrate-binding protein
VDQLITEGRTSSDLEIRKDSYRQFQEVWQDLVPGVVIAYPHAVYAHSEAVKDISNVILFTSASRFTDVQKWRR